MATAVDSPGGSPLSSPVSSRRVLDVRMNHHVGGFLQCRPSGNPLLALPLAGADPFALEDDGNSSDEEDDNQNHQESTTTTTTTSARQSASMINRQQQQQRMNDMAALLMDTSSQQSCLSLSQATSEVLTQSAMEYTQMTQDGSTNLSLSQSQSPFPTAEKPPLPWGRLMPCSGGKAVDLMPQAPPTDGSSSDPASVGPRFCIVGLDNVHSSDIFNVYTLGRSLKCDIVANKPREHDNNDNDKDQKLAEWGYGLISNRHARIYCCLPDAPRGGSSISNGKPGASISLPASSMEVWIEDSSNNGTWINQSIHLKKGQKRQLHAGDEISMVNKNMLRKRIRDEEQLQAVYQRYAFVFVNMAHHQHIKTAKPRPAPTPKVMGATLCISPVTTSRMPPTSSSAKRRSGLVNPRAMNYPPGSRSPKPARSPYPGGRHHPQVGPHPTTKFGNAQGQTGRTPPPPPAMPGSADLLSSQPSPRRIEAEYEIRDLLGRGTCGEVRRAINRLTGKQLAVKIVSLPPPALLQQQREKETQQWQAEAKILQTMEHPYIVRLVDVFHTDAHLYLLLDLCTGGDLFDRIIKSTKYSETNSRRVMRRLLSAMHYIHEDCHLVHRDIKPENILLAGANPWDVRITDFGVAKDASSKLKTFCGTPMYFAPEVLQRRHTVLAEGSYGKSADVWSLGVVLYILLSGTPPYDIDGAAGMDVVLKKGLKICFPPQFWSNVSSQAVDLVKRMLNKDPQERITIVEACTHPWILAEDGDTHRHPLEDPRLMSVTKKRLFESSSGTPMPTPISPRKPPSKKRRKVSMEGGGVSLPLDGLRDTTAAAIERGPTAKVNNHQRPLSPVENILEASNSPQSSPSGGAKKLTAAMQDENDENSTCGEATTATTTSTNQAESSAIMKPNASKASSELKVSPGLIASLKARILAGNGDSNSLATLPLSRPSTGAALMRPLNNGKKIVSPLEPSSAPAELQAKNQGTGPKSAFRGINRPSHWKNSAATAAKITTEECLSDSDATARGSNKKSSSSSKPQRLIKAEELPDDRICSQFSDEEDETEDSAKPGDDGNSNGENRGKTKSKASSADSSTSLSKKRAPTNTQKASSGKDVKKAKTTAAKKAKPTTSKSAKKGGMGDSGKVKGDDNQTKLNRWFQPVKKSG